MSFPRLRGFDYIEPQRPFSNNILGIYHRVPTPWPNFSPEIGDLSDPDGPNELPFLSERGHTWDSPLVHLSQRASLSAARHRGGPGRPVSV